MKSYSCGWPSLSKSFYVPYFSALFLMAQIISAIVTAFFALLKFVMTPAQICLFGKRNY
jgi:hypothetical protein